MVTRLGVGRSVYSLGVDIGTTSVVAATLRHGRTEVVALSATGFAVPALVYRHHDGTLRTGEAAARRAIATPHRVAGALTRRLVDGTPVVLGERPQSVTTLLSAQLRDVLDTVRTLEGGDPERITLTRPAGWGAFREELFAQVPARLGWDDVSVVGEAAAVAAHHRRRRGRTDAETVAVYDLGGGGFDATVLRLDGAADEAPEILGTPQSVEDLDDVFDHAVLTLADEACDGALVDGGARDPAERTVLARLRRECGLAKEALSRDTEVLVPVTIAGRPRDVEITRAAFEERIRPTVDATVEALLRALRDADVDPEDPDALSAVLLVGGGSRIPLVARRVSAALGRTVTADPRAPWAAALGAAGLATTVDARDPDRLPEGPFRTFTPPRGLVPMVPALVPPGAPAPGEREPADPPDADVTQRVDVDRPPARDVEDPADVEDDAPTGPVPLPGDADPDPDPKPDPDPDPEATIRVPPPDGPADTEAETGDASEVPPEPDFRPAPGRRRRFPWAGGTPRRSRHRGVAVAVVLLVLALGAVALWMVMRSSAPTGAALPEPTAPVLPAALAPGPSSVAASVAVPRTGRSLRGASAPGFAAISPNGRLLYLADRVANSVTVVDTRDPGSRTTIAVPAGPPQYLAVAPDGRRLYASVFDEARSVTSVVVLDTVTRTVVATVPVPSRPFGLAVSPDGRSLWVPNQDTANVTVIDTARNAVVRQVPTSSNPHWVAFSRDGTRVYVSLEDDDEVVELDPVTDREVSRVPTGDGPFAVAVHPTRPLAAEVDYAGNTLTAFDTERNERVATVPVGRLPQSVAWAPDGRFAYVVSTTDATVTVIDAASFAVTATIPTPPRPTSIAVAPDGRTGYVTCEGAIAVVELAG